MPGRLVSVVLPVHNGARYLREALESCLRQTHAALELLAVDDASTDATPEILAACRDPRLRIIRSEVQRGLAGSLNAGFSSSAGAFLTWTSDDNLYEPEALARMTSFLEERGADLVFCDYYRFSDDSRAAPRLVRLVEPPPLERQNAVGPCFLYTRRVRESVGDYDPAYNLLAEDYDYWIRVSKRFPLRHLAEPLYRYREHGGSLTARSPRAIPLTANLLRLSHGLVDLPQAVDFCVDLAAQRHGRARRLVKPWVRLSRAARARRVLEGFQRGQATVDEARRLLEEIVAGSPSGR